MNTYQVWEGIKVWRKGIIRRNQQNIFTFEGQVLGKLERGEENGFTLTVYKTVRGEIIIHLLYWSAIEETQQAVIHKYSSMKDAAKEFGEILNIR